MGGGGGKSTSTTASTTTQAQTDSRQAVQNGIAVGASGNYSQSTSNSSSTNLSATDSHAVTDSGNSSNSTSVTYNGTDQGAVQIASLATQLAQASGEQSMDALTTGENLQAQSYNNTLTFASHTLDVLGDAIDNMSASTALGANASIMQTQTAASTSNVQAASNQQMVKYGAIAAAAVVAAIVIAKG